VAPHVFRATMTSMTNVPEKARSVLATIVGYVIVALVAFWLLGAVLGTLRFLLKAVLALVVLGVLITLWARLKSPRAG
jgi:hypothetical protein